MRKAAVIVLCFSAAGAAVFGSVKVVPFVRYAIEMDRHARQAALREPGAEREWRREFGDPAQMLSAFPRRRDSATAIRLVELAHSVGIDMARPKREQPVSRESDAGRTAKATLGRYGEAELTKSGGDVDPPPEAARVFLEARSRDINAIVTFLSSARPPAWASDVSLGAEAPVPNLLGQIHLQRLLVAEALNRANLGRRAEAEQVLDASWALNASLCDRPDVISQLIAISVARMQVGLARRLVVDPALWGKCFADHDYRSSLLRAMEVESVAGLRRLRTGSSRWDRASRVDFLDSWRTFLVSLRDSPVADGPIKPRYKNDDNPKSEGAILAMIALPNLAGAVRRVDRLLVDTELTQLILQARRLKACVGHWPNEIPNFSASRIAGTHWIYSVDADGRLTVSLSRELHWEGQHGLVLPLRYVSS